jgi:hypothetical protein
MKKKTFTLLASVALMACLLGIFLFAVLMPQYAQGYNAALIDKKARVMAIDEPKIVLVGNSNLVFGVDSAAMEAELGMPVVNMGLHGGAGNAFHEEMAKFNVQPGDIYIICHTDYADIDEVSDPGLAWITLENHFDLWPLVRTKDIPTMVEAFPGYVKRCISLWAAGEGNLSTGDEYARDAFNEYGDNVFPRPVSRPTLPFAEQTVPGISKACTDRLNALNAYMQERGATLLLAAYPIAFGEFTPSLDDYDAFQMELEEALDFPIISYFTDYLFQYDYFYDTIYHLTDDGVDMRTNLLIGDIQWWMESAEEI